MAAKRRRNDKDLELEKDIVLIVKRSAAIEQRLRSLTGIKYRPGDKTGLMWLARQVLPVLREETLVIIGKVADTRNTLVHSLTRVPDRNHFTQLCDQIEADLTAKEKTNKPFVGGGILLWDEEEGELEEDPRYENGVKVRDWDGTILNKIERESDAPIGKIEEIRIKPKTKIGTSLVLTITPIFTINNSEGKQCELIASFLRDSDATRALKDANAPVVFDIQFTPRNGKTSFDDLSFKIPYNHLLLAPGECNLKFTIRLYCYTKDHLVLAAESDWRMLKFTSKTK
jgi:hypothetical protein